MLCVDVIEENKIVNVGFGGIPDNHPPREHGCRMAGIIAANGKIRGTPIRTQFIRWEVRCS